MGKQMAVEVCNRLEKEFKRSFPAAGLKLITGELVAASDNALERSFDHFVLSNRFPSPEQLRDRVHFEAKLILAAEARERESEWHKTKGGATRDELDKQPNIFKTFQPTAHGRRAITVMKLTINNNIPRSVVIEDLREMDKEYPGYGYGEIADDFQRKWGGANGAAGG